jgi:DNA-binding response OmpR family regulator
MSMGHLVVLVDDDHDILFLLSEALRAEGIEVRCFRSAALALEYMHVAPPALVVTDLRMPGMSGQEFIQRLRAEHGERVAVIVLSASSDGAAVRHLPVQAFVGKPFDLEDFLRLVGKLLVTEWQPLMDTADCLDPEERTCVNAGVGVQGGLH